MSMLEDGLSAPMRRVLDAMMPLEKEQPQSQQAPVRMYTHLFIP